MHTDTGLAMGDERRAVDSLALEKQIGFEPLADKGFWQLPLELQQQILEDLDRRSVKAFCLVNWRAWHVGIGFIWRDVKLVDCRTRHKVPEQYNAWRDPAAGANDEPGAAYDPMEGQDEHDDTPIVRKLLVLASNKTIASKVLTLTHKCHLSPPSIVRELPGVSFAGQTLSSDFRTLQLASWAVANMISCRTLRIIHGHYNLTAVLLTEFFNPKRQLSVKKLWLESCSLAGFPINAIGGLESIRLRRIPLAGSDPHYTLSRAGLASSLLDGAGGFYETTVDFLDGVNGLHSPSEISRQELDRINTPALCFLNEKVYENVPAADAYYQQRLFEDSTLAWTVRHGEMLKPIEFLMSSCNSLKSLTLDWLLSNTSHQSDFTCQADLFGGLSRLSFPNLRAFQFRNAATGHTRLMPDIFLLEPPTVDDLIEGEYRRASSIDLLSFMERHPKLQSLAWPIDRFFSYNSRAQSDADLERVRAVIVNLGQTLRTLRVDFFYTSHGEPQTDTPYRGSEIISRFQRRSFISRFASYMRNLKHLKIEGGIPRDEKREIIRAVHASPLEKLVVIGTSCPIGNTWGAHGHDLQSLYEGGLEFSGNLEDEDTEVVDEAVRSNMPEVPENFNFTPQYGWEKSPPLMNSIAMHHASTITELKFCGYTGSPVCHNPLPITAGLLYHLRHFHNLRTLIMSIWLLTFFEGNRRDSEIIDYWLDQRKSSSTALVVVQNSQNLPAQPMEDGVHMDQSQQLGVEADSNLSISHSPATNEDIVVEDSGAIMSSNFASQNQFDGATEQYSAAQTDLFMYQEILTEQEQHSTDEENSIFSQDDVDEQLMAMGIGLGSPLLLNVEPESIIVTDAHPISTPGPAPGQNPWEYALQTLYSPRALAGGVFSMLSPHLSPQARQKRYKGGQQGVNIRSSFLLGVDSRDIFDLDFCIDEFGIVEETLKGPREEAERFWEKLERRQWF